MSTGEPIRVAQMRVQPDWIDHTGRVTNGGFYAANIRALDSFLEDIGFKRGGLIPACTHVPSETHIRQLGEATSDDTLTLVLQVLHVEEGLFHSFIHINVGESCVATVEQVNLHVDKESRQICPAAPDVHARLMAVARAHKELPMPEGAGEPVGGTSMTQ